MQLLMKVQKKEVLLEDALSNEMGIISPDGASTVVTELMPASARVGSLSDKGQLSDTL